VHKSLYQKTRIALLDLIYTPSPSAQNNRSSNGGCSTSFFLSLLCLHPIWKVGVTANKTCLLWEASYAPCIFSASKNMVLIPEHPFPDLCHHHLFQLPFLSHPVTLRTSHHSGGDLGLYSISAASCNALIYPSCLEGSSSKLAPLN
jgi:hypothetical protein